MEPFDFRAGRAMTEQASNTAPVEVIEKAMKVIEALADAPEGLSLQALTERAGLAKSTVHRLLSTWIDLGYVSRTPAGGYAVGLAVLELSRKVVRRSRVAEVAREVLRLLQRDTGESVYVGIYRAGRVVLLDGLEGAHALRVVCDLGEQCYLHASAQGRAVAAFLDEKVLAQRLREQGLAAVTARTVTNREIVLRRIAEDRETGYSINWEETVEGAVCLGVPFFAGQEGAVVGSLGLSIPLSRATEAHIAHCLGALQDSAHRMTVSLLDFPTEPEARPRSEAAARSFDAPLATANPRRTARGVS
jgi:IclR family acetate operon transcriptional repressor